MMNGGLERTFQLTAPWEPLTPFYECTKMHFLIIYIHFWSSAALVGWLFHSLLLICWSTCISAPRETHHRLVRELPLNWHTQKMNIKPRGLLRWTGSHGGWALGGISELGLSWRNHRLRRVSGSVTQMLPGFVYLSPPAAVKESVIESKL